MYKTFVKAAWICKSSGLGGSMGLLSTSEEWNSTSASSRPLNNLFFPLIGYALYLPGISEDLVGVNYESGTS